MPGYRAARVAELVHRELARRLRLDIKDPRIGDVSITHVEVSSDLTRAVISYMPLGGGEPSDDMVEGLAQAARRLRGPVGRALRTRHSPELVFQPDEHFEQVVRLTSILDRIGDELRAGEGEE